MEEERFGLFHFKISFLSKCIKSLESYVASQFGVKGVHLFWIYSLMDSPRGMTASEIAQKNGVNRSLVSREIQRLAGAGLVCFDAEESAGNRYNARILLTEQGRAVAEQLRDLAMNIQGATDGDIRDEEIAVFYSVLNRFCDNLGRVTEEKKSFLKIEQ